MSAKENVSILFPFFFITGMDGSIRRPSKNFLRKGFEAL